MSKEIERAFLVTGSASGIGAAVCRRLAAPGTAFLIHARKNAAGAERVAAAVREKGGVAEVALADLAEPGAAAALAEEPVRRFGRLDVLVSNAGHADKTPYLEVAEEALEGSHRLIETAFFHLTRAAVPALRQSPQPRIVAISSFVAHVFRNDVRLFPVTAAAKAGLEAMVRTLAIELAGDRITANVVVPGFTEKDPDGHSALSAEQWRAIAAKIPLGRIARPDDIANAVAFFADPASEYVTGQTLHVNGGLHI